MPKYDVTERNEFDEEAGRYKSDYSRTHIIEAANIQEARDQANQTARAHCSDHREVRASVQVHRSR